MSQSSLPVLLYPCNISTVLQVQGLETDTRNRHWASH